MDKANRANLETLNNHFITVKLKLIFSTIKINSKYPRYKKISLKYNTTPLKLKGNLIIGNNSKDRIRCNWKFQKLTREISINSKSW